MLITSRLPVELPDGAEVVANRDLGELTSAGARKMRLSRAGLRKLSRSAWDAVMRDLGGHPKALDLLDGYLKGREDRAKKLLERLDEAQGKVEAGLEARRQRRGRRLLVDQVRRF